MSLFHSCLWALLLLPTLALAEPVNINTADAATLARELKGIGETRAQAIVEHRSQHGPFRSIEELSLVKGIGPKVIEKNRANLRVERAPARASSPSPRPAVPAQAPRSSPAPRPSVTR